MYSFSSPANNPVYNLFPNMLSHLSENMQLSAETFQRIMRFLLSFIDKERQMEQLVEKLCHRFPTTKGLFVTFYYGLSVLALFCCT